MMIASENNVADVMGVVFPQNAFTTSSQVQRYNNTARMRVIVLAYARRFQN